MASADQDFRAAFARRDAPAVRALLQQHPGYRARIDDPLFPFDSPAIVCYANDPAMVEVLLEAGADPNARSRWWAGGFHALHSATGAAAERLIAAGALVDACAAAHLGRVDLLSDLLAADPSRVHERGGDGQMPLHFARSREVVDLLIAAGADLDARDVDHRATAAEWMIERRAGAGRYDLARYLVERGATADIFLAAALGLTSHARSLVAADPSLLDARTGQGAYGAVPPSSFHIYFWTIGNGRSPLEVAAQFAQRPTLDAMLSFASPKQQLLFACGQGDEGRARQLVAEHADMVASLAPADHRALADAAWNGNTRAVVLMMDLGFDPRVPGHDAGTALHLAAWEGATEAVAAILRHPDARELVALRDAHHDGTPLGWCCHGSIHGNPAHDHAGVARLLLDAGADVEPGTDASRTVRAVLASAGR